MSEFAHKSVLITGAGRGVGRETAACIKLLVSDSNAFVTGQTVMFDRGRNLRCCAKPDPK